MFSLLYCVAHVYAYSSSFHCMKCGSVPVMYVALSHWACIVKVAGTPNYVTSFMIHKSYL